MTTEHGEVLKRLEKLERQNRRMKLSAIVALTTVGAFVLMGQSRAPHTPSELKARSFVLVDTNGKTRALLDILANWPELVLYDAKNNPTVMLQGSPSGPGLSLTDANGKAIVILDETLGKPELILNGNEKTGAILDVPSSGPELFLNGNGKAGIGLATDSEGPGLELTDESGFETQIGVSDLITPTTGETHKTSAASIVLFGKDKKVLWSAPPQE